MDENDKAKRKCDLSLHREMRNDCEEPEFRTTRARGRTAI